MAFQLDRSACRRRLQVFFFVLMASLANGAMYGGELMLTFDVPHAVPKSSPGGWGAIVLNFDRPITSGTFIFEPECPDPLAGNLNPMDNSVIQLGPGRYGLGETGTEITAPSNSPHLGDEYGQLEITITYPGDIEPMLQGGFWQNKLTTGGQNPVRVFDFIEGDDRRIPEPSALILATCAASAFFVARRQQRAA